MTDDLVTRAKTLSAMINLGERVAWGQDTAMIDELAARIEALVKERAPAQPAPQGVDALAESRNYALALEEELRLRAEKTDQLLLLANSMDADFEAYAKAHPAALRVTGPNSDGEYWLHIKAGGRSGGINLGDQHGSICKQLLDAVSETRAKE